MRAIVTTFLARGLARAALRRIAWKTLGLAGWAGAVAVLVAIGVSAGAAERGSRPDASPRGGGVVLDLNAPATRPGLAAWYPLYMPQAGIFHGFETTGRGTVARIDAARYRLAPDFQVSTPLMEDAPQALLRPGTEVGFRVEADLNARGDVVVLRRVWTLPKGTVRGDGDRHGLLLD